MIHDLVNALSRWNIWTTLGWQDICQRYRRNTIGPFWITLSNCLTIGAMAVIFTYIFKQKVEFFIPYLTAGMTIWSFLGSIITESTNVFVVAKPILFSVRLPLSFHLLRMIWKNLIIFAHLGAAYIAVAIYFHVEITYFTFLFLPALIIIVIDAYWFSMLFGLMCARYRDLSQIVSILFGISMYLTPIFWTEDSLGDYKKFLLFNPLYCLLKIVRDSLLGIKPDIPAYTISLCIAFIGCMVTIFYFSRNRNNLIFWV